MINITSYYVNPNNRVLTSNIKNIEIKDREAFNLKTSGSSLEKQNILGVTYEKGKVINAKNYTSKGVLSGKNSAKQVIEAMNQSADKGFEFWVEGDTFYLGNGMSCSTKELQTALGKNSAKELSVTDNKVVFDNNSYYKFTDKNGKEHSIASFAGALTAGVGTWDKEAADYANFWNCMARKDTTFISMEYSPDEVRSRLGQVGIAKGFFTISVGAKETTQYLSQGKKSVAVYSREQYDERYYNHIQSGNLTKGYNMGTVFKIGGKEYAVNGDGKVDVPYGVDIWDVEYPAE